MFCVVAPSSGTRSRAVQDKLRRSIALAGLMDDTARHVLDGMSAHLGAQHRLYLESQASLAELVRAARQPVSDETIRRLEQAAVNGADRRAADLARTHWQRNIVLAATVLVGAVLLAGGGGYLWGRGNALASVRETEAGLATMFRDGPDAAREWLNLALWNDPKAALARCGGSTTSVENGRRAC